MSYKLLAATLVCFAGVVLMLLVGPDSPDLIGGWSIQWHQANCSLREGKVARVTTSGYRAIFRVDVYSLDGALLSPPFGVTAVGRGFGWGGYYDGRNEEELATKDVVAYPAGRNYTCYHTGSFVEFPTDSGCKRCTSLVYFNYDEETLIESQKRFLGFSVAGYVCLAASFIYFIYKIATVFIVRFRDR